MRWQQQAKRTNITVEGVEVGRVWVTCNQCGVKWSPNLRAGGYLPRGWWKCPSGCNNPVVKEDPELAARLNEQLDAFFDDSA